MPKHRLPFCNQAPRLSLTCCSRKIMSSVPSAMFIHPVCPDGFPSGFRSDESVLCRAALAEATASSPCQESPRIWRMPGGSRQLGRLLWLNPSPWPLKRLCDASLPTSALPGQRQLRLSGLRRSYSTSSWNRRRARPPLQKSLVPWPVAESESSSAGRLIISAVCPFGPRTRQPHPPQVNTQLSATTAKHAPVLAFSDP